MSAVSFADNCRRVNSTSLVLPRGYIALYPRTWRVTGRASGVLARRGATDCRWTISAEPGRRITLFSARVGAHLYRANELTDSKPLWCPASVQLVELDQSAVQAASFNVCLRASETSDSSSAHDTISATRTVYESRGSRLQVRLSFDKDSQDNQVSTTGSADQWRLSDIFHVLYYIGISIITTIIIPASSSS